MKTSSPSHLRSRFLARPACFWHVLVAFAGFTLGPQPARAAVTEAWVQRSINKWVSNSDDAATKVVRDAVGDIIVAGSTDDGLFGPDMLIIKYSGAEGTVLWQKRYNGPAIDSPSGVAVDASGNVVVTGLSASSGLASSSIDSYTAKYAAMDGALLWEQRSTNGGALALVVDGSGDVVVTGATGIWTVAGMIAGHYYTAKYAAADGALLWERRGTNGVGRALAVDGSGNVVATGSSENNNGDTDYYTAKYAAANGALLWERRYNGPSNNSDYASDVAVDSSGNVVVTGTSNNANSSDSYTAKYAAADGALLWEKRSTNGEARAIALDGSDNVIVTGYSVNAGRSDYYTAKYAATNGALIWEQRYNGSNRYGEALAVAVDGSGNVAVTGVSRNNNGDDDYYTAKYAGADGGLLWAKRYNGSTRAATDSQAGWSSYDYANAVAVDNSGNVIVTGQSQSEIDVNGNAPYDYYTLKYAATDGALLWGQRYNGATTSYDQAQAVTVDGSGNVAVTGYSHSERGGTDYYTAKYALADGGLLWEQRYHTGKENRANAVAVDGSGNVVVTGSSWNSFQVCCDNSGIDYYTAKYAAANGTLLWEKRYETFANDSAQAVAVDSSGNVVVTGNSWNGTNNDYYTAKYAAADGVLLWEKRYHGPANSDDYSNAVAVDASNNVVVAGSSGNGSNTDYYTAKYAAADGALLWEKRYNGPANRDDHAQALAVDGSGNVVVTGVSDNGTNNDYYTAKYAAADGVLLWGKSYNGPANSDDYSNAVAVDASGNVVVTGFSYNESNTDYYTAKYAAADGALLWEQRYNGPANSSDFAQAVAVDDNGNVVVTGVSDNGTNTDYYTVKYGAADGALLWEKRYNGPANGNDGVLTSHSLAIGPNGMVAITGSSGGDYATVVYREVLPPIAIALVSTGVRISFSGTPGLSYKIERAPAITGPWTTINIQTAPASGLLDYLDAPPLPGQAFYRTVQP